MISKASSSRSNKSCRNLSIFTSPRRDWLRRLLSAIQKKWRRKRKRNLSRSLWMTKIWNHRARFISWQNTTCNTSTVMSSIAKNLDRLNWKTRWISKMRSFLHLSMTTKFVLSKSSAQSSWSGSARAAILSKFTQLCWVTSPCLASRRARPDNQVTCYSGTNIKVPTRRRSCFRLKISPLRRRNL